MWRKLTLLSGVLVLFLLGRIVGAKTAAHSSEDISETTPPLEAATSPEESPNLYAANHTQILTTWFRGGTPAGQGDKGTSNVDSYWYKDWRTHLGGADNGRLPLVRPGLDNLYYFALPCPDYSKQQLDESHIVLAKAAGLTLPTDISYPQSAFKNLWLEVNYRGKKVYAQWEDIGPLGPRDKEDCSYVFGDSRPRQETSRSIDSALDLSPTAFSYLNAGNLDQGIIRTSWRFVVASDVPDGPWKANVTTAGPDL